MAEYTKNDVQLVQPNQPVLLDTTIGCNKGYVIHREGSGILTLRGIVNGINSCFARYQATFVGNIGIPSDGTAPSPIGIAVAIDGEPVLTSKALVTPAAVVPATPVTSEENYFNVTSTAIITVPRGCCFNISVENTAAVAINVRNANLVVMRIA